MVLDVRNQGVVVPSSSDFEAEQPTAVEGVSLEFQETVTPAPTIEDVEEKAGKAHFVLAQNSPGLAELRLQYQNGNDAVVNEMAAQKEKDDLQKAQTDLITEFFGARVDPSVPLSEEERLDLEAFSTTPEIDTENSLNDQFVDKYFNRSIEQMLETNPEIQQAVDEDPDKAAAVVDSFTEDRKLVEFAKQEMQRLLADPRYGASKKMSDVLEKFLVPGKEAYELFVLDEDIKDSGFDLPDDSLLPGRNKAEKFQYIYSLPAGAQRAILPVIVDALAERNVLTAQLFLNQLINYSASDQRFDNIIAALDIVDTGTTVGVLAAGFHMFALAKASQAIARGSLRKPVGVTRALDAIGDVTNSAFLQAKRRITRKANNTPELQNVEEVLDEVPTLWNPDSLFLGGDTGLSTLQQDRLLTLFKKHGHTFMGGIDHTLTIRRLRDGQVDDVLAAANEFIPLEYPTLQGKLIGARVKTSSEKTLTNNDIIEVSIGDLNGDLFTSQAQARRMADIYDLEGFGVKRVGGRYALTLEAAINESTPLIRSLPLPSNQQVPKHNDLVDVFRGAMTPEATFSPVGSEERAIAVLGAARLTGIARTADDMFRALPRKSRNRLSTYLNAERGQVDDLGVRGRFATTVAELQDGWRRAFDRSPTENEIAGYFTYRQLSDMDYVIRNFTVLGSKLRKGIKNTTIPQPGGNRVEFEGAPATPSAITGEPASVLITKGNGQNEFVRVRTPEDRARVSKLVEEDGYMMTQVSPQGETQLASNAGIQRTVGTAGVDFVLSKGTKYARLGPKQIEYTPGAHRIYRQLR